jgi:FG-GAP-like repeat
MNKDGFEDIVTLDKDGYASLYMNMETRFRPREDIAYIPELSERGISLGDFTGDGYADIIGLDHSGALVYIDNAERRFARMEISSAGGDVPTGITDFRIYDMDVDSRDDIVYMSE